MHEVAKFTNDQFLSYANRILIVQGALRRIKSTKKEKEDMVAIHFLKKGL